MEDILQGFPLLKGAGGFTLSVYDSGVCPSVNECIYESLLYSGIALDPMQKSRQNLQGYPNSLEVIFSRVYRCPCLAWLALGQMQPVHPQSIFSLGLGIWEICELVA